MDMNAISAVLPQLQAAYGGSTGGGDVSGADFAQLLMAMSGQNLGSLDGSATGGDLMGSGLMGGDLLGSGLLGGDLLNSGLFGTGLFGGMQGFSMDGAQSATMLKALQAMLDNDKPMVTDPTLAYLLNMLKSTQGTDEAKLQELMKEIQDRVGEIGQENGSQAAAQQMMAAMGGFMEYLGMQTNQNPVYAALGASTSEGALATVLESSPSDLVRMITNAASGTNAQNAGNTQQAENQAATQTAQASAETAAKAEQVQYEAAPKADFESAVRSAVSKFSAGAEEAKPAEAIDVDALQAKVDDGVYLRNTSIATNTQATQQPVSTQLYQPIANAIKSGSEEVTVKLNPEGLGEVTIKLAKSAEGDMTLAIIAKKPETQQLLSDQMQALQNTLKPLKVDVDSILTQRQYELLSHQQNFDNGQRQAYNPHRAAYYARGTQSSAGYNDEMQVASIAAQANAPMQALNALA